MRFFDQVPSQFTAFGGADGATATMVEPDRQDARAAVALFRQIYTPSEPTSAAVVLNVLKRSAAARDGPLRDPAIAELKSLRTWTTDLLAAGTGIGVSVYSGDVEKSISPAQILDAYFHGDYLHSGNARREMVERLDDVGVPRFEFYNVLRELTKVYYVVANVVDRVLAVPELLDVDA